MRIRDPDVRFGRGSSRGLLQQQAQGCACAAQPFPGGRGPAAHDFGDLVGAESIPVVQLDHLAVGRAEQGERVAQFDVREVVTRPTRPPRDLAGLRARGRASGTRRRRRCAPSAAAKGDGTGCAGSNRRQAISKQSMVSSLACSRSSTRRSMYRSTAVWCSAKSASKAARRALGGVPERGPGTACSVHDRVSCRDPDQCSGGLSAMICRAWAVSASTSAFIASAGPRGSARPRPRHSTVAS